jgi:acyl-CoA thioesterase FadM
MSEKTALYVHRYQVAFSDTDAANIAFTGRFPNFCLDAIEGWFRDRLGTDWYRLNNDLDLGTPFVHLSVDMRSPLTPRDMLLTTVALARAGGSSLEFSVSGRTETEGRLSFSGRFLCVFVAKATMRATAIPPPFRALADDEAKLAARVSEQ